VLPSTGLTEEGVEGIVSSTHGLIGGHLSVRLDAVLQTVKLPTAVTSLDTGLAHVNRDTFCFLNRIEIIKLATLL